MALAQADFSQKALMLLAAGAPNSPWLSMEVEAGLAQGQALQELGNSVAFDPEKFGLLQQEYPITLSSSTGAGNLAAAVGALTGLADVVWGSVQWGHVKDTATLQTLLYVPNRMDFERYQLPGQLYFTTYQGGIYTRTANSDYDNDKSGVQGPLNVLANYYPSVGNLSTLPQQLETDAVLYLARTLAQKYGPGLEKAA